MARKSQTATLEVTSPRIPEPSAQLLGAAAKLPPRDIVQVEGNILTRIQQNPALARICMYCKPVGKRGGYQQFATGPGIRFAELALQEYGGLWVRVYKVDETPYQSKQNPGTVTTECVVFDLRTLNITSAQDTSPVYGTNLVDTAQDRSFAFSRRDAMLQHVRPVYEAIEEDIKRAVIMSYASDDGGDLASARRNLWTHLQQKYAAFGVNKYQLENFIEKEPERNEAVIKLLGILNWLNDGNGDKAHEVFPPSSKPAVEDTEELKDEPADKTAAESAQEQMADADAETEPGADRREFLERVNGLAEKAGLSDKQVTDALMAEFEIMGGLECVPAADFTRVHDYFLGRAEGKAGS